MNLLKRITDNEIFGTGGNSLSEQRKTVRVVLLDDDNLASVLYLGKYNFYMMPGGGIEENETPEQALHRETQEETGCDSEIICNLGIIEENSLIYNYSCLSLCFLAKIKGEKGLLNLTQEESDEETQVQWHNLHEILRLIKNQNVDELKLIRDERSIAIMKFIQERDITLLNEAIKVLTHQAEEKLCV